VPVSRWSCPYIAKRPRTRDRRAHGSFGVAVVVSSWTTHRVSSAGGSPAVPVGDRLVIGSEASTILRVRGVLPATARSPASPSPLRAIELRRARRPFCCAGRDFVAAIPLLGMYLA